MDFSFNDEQAAIRNWVRTFVERELLPRESEALRRERAGQAALTSAELAALQATARKSGFWGVQTPEKFGGMQLSAVSTALIEMELGRTFLPFKFGGYADIILFHANEEQQQQYLYPTLEGELVSCFAMTEPGAGSDATAIRTRAVKDGSDWIIDGEKTFITRGDIADFAMVFAVTDPSNPPSEGITCFLVDRSMGWESSTIPTMGQWGPASLVFDGVRVPERNVLGEVGRGLALAMQWIGRGRYILPANAVGACERLLEMGMDHARNRVTFGRPIADRQAIQWMVADSAVELQALRLLVMHAAWKVDSGADSRHAQSMAKLYGGITANEIVDRVLQMHGGMGYTRELPIERWYRELRVLRIYEGTDEIQRQTIARNLFKGYASVRS